MDPGPLLLFGSGETAASARAIYDHVLGGLALPMRVAVLETPAGFQPNSADVAGAVADYLREHLPHLRPDVQVVPARKRDTPYSPDDPGILRPLLTADVAFLGPGSPTYAVRQLQGSLAWNLLMARQRQGMALLLASAAAIASGAWALPVYEIYKAGEDLHWRPGLDLWGAWGLSLVLVPHWDNNEGGAKHDTSRCFMGGQRFADLLRLLPPGQVVVGIDEHTALTVDLTAERCEVLGRGGVTLARDGVEERLESGTTFPLGLLGEVRHPAPGEGLPAGVWEMIRAAQGEAAKAAEADPPAAVWDLVTRREAARRRGDWAAADDLRERLAVLGWQVQDTPAGPQLNPRPDA